MIDFPNPQISKCIEVTFLPEATHIYQLLPVSLLYSLNVGIALSALSHLNIPMYGYAINLLLFTCQCFEKDDDTFCADW